MFSLRSMPQRRWAHPRERGEHFSEADANRPCAGSSPRARGAWLELEGWARSPVEAAEVLDEAVWALHKAARVRGSKVRFVEDAELPSSLPTGEEGWDRYTAAVLISVRSPSTR